MPNILLPPATQDYADKQVAAGIYANVSEVARAGIRILIADDGATAFYALRSELERRAKEPAIEVDLEELL